jgi:hypothetical protein
MWRHVLPPQSLPITIVPDASIDLEWINGRARIAGPDGRAHRESLPPGTVVLGLRFRPGRAAAWLGLPARALLNRRVPLDDIRGSVSQSIFTGLEDAQDPGTVALRLARLSACRGSRRPTVTRDMMGALALVSAGAPPGRELIPWLRGELALSERTLRRRFDEAFGYGPRTLDRILRYQRFLTLVRAESGATLAALASAAGYADQAHLVRESRRLADGTPSEIVAALTA